MTFFKISLYVRFFLASVYIFLLVFSEGSIVVGTNVAVDTTQTSANEIQTAFENNGTVIAVNVINNPTGMSK